MPIAQDTAALAPLGVSFSDERPVSDWTGVLGVMSFGAPAIRPPPPGVPVAAIDVPPLGRPWLQELWVTDRPVRYIQEPGASLAVTGSVLFAVIEPPGTAGLPLEQLTRSLYDRLFAILGTHGYPFLFRIWNYLSGITADEGGLERYRRFTLGRHEAFAAHGHPVESAPAACALGSRSGPPVLAFLAAKEPGQPIENPRQLSAYRYPERYGPRSPTFSRALLAATGGRSQLFISGTASIVGHESRHPGDPSAQAEEAMTNIEALLGEARRGGFASGGRLMLKCYLRHPSMLEAVRPVIAARLKPEDRVVFLNAEICRSELLVEIEGALI